MLRQSMWALAAAASFSTMAAFVKFCNNLYGPLELVFYRSVFTVTTILVIVWANGYSLKTKEIGGHLKRDILGATSVTIWFFTLGELPLGTNITLTYTTSLFLAVNFIILALLRRTSIPWGAICAILIGFTGIVTVVQPSFAAGQEIPALLCLSVAFLDLFTYWTVRKLGQAGEPSWRIVFYFALFCTVASFIGVNVFEGGFHAPTLLSGLCVLGMGAFATLGMLTSTRAWVGGNMLLVSCLGFSAIPFSELIGIFFFGHEPSFVTLTGMLFIIVAGMTATVFTKREEALMNANEKQ